MKVFLLSGKAENGKTTAANLLKEIIEENGSTARVINYGDLLKFICEKYFDWNGEKDSEGRDLLQSVGQYIRSNDDYYFVDFILKMLDMLPTRWEYTIIGDCRYDNEIVCIKNLYTTAKHIRIFRPEFKSQLNKKQLMHPSEKFTGIDNKIGYDEDGNIVQSTVEAIDNLDYYVLNDGTIKDLKDKLKKIFDEVSANEQTQQRP